MTDFPNVFSADMFQSATCGFDQIWPWLVIHSLARPISDIVFAEFLDEEDFWKCLKWTTSERKMDKFDVFGIVISAADLSKVWEKSINHDYKIIKNGLFWSWLRTPEGPILTQNLKNKTIHSRALTSPWKIMAYLVGADPLKHPNDPLEPPRCSKGP